MAFIYELNKTEFHYIQNIYSEFYYIKLLAARLSKSFP